MLARLHVEHQVEPENGKEKRSTGRGKRVHVEGLSRERCSLASHDVPRGSSDGATSTCYFYSDWLDRRCAGAGRPNCSVSVGHVAAGGKFASLTERNGSSVSADAAAAAPVAGGAAPWRGRARRLAAHSRLGHTPAA